MPNGVGIGEALLADQKASEYVATHPITLSPTPAATLTGVEFLKYGDHYYAGDGWEEVIELVQLGKHPALNADAADLMIAPDEWRLYTYTHKGGQKFAKRWDLSQDAARHLVTQWVGLAAGGTHSVRCYLEEGAVSLVTELQRDNLLEIRAAS